MTREEVEKILNELTISSKGELITEGNDEKYVVNISNSDEYSQIYTKLENSNFELLEDLILLRDNSTGLIYENKDYQIRLMSNYDDDIYKLIILPNKNMNVSESNKEQIKESLYISKKGGYNGIN